MDLGLTSLAENLATLLMLAAPAIGAGVFHMAVVKCDLLSWLKYPLDGGRILRGKRLFGDHKTLRGVIVMVVFSIGFCYVLELCLHFFPSIQKYNLLDFDHYAPWFYGAVYGFGYTLSELPNSYLKRRKSVAPGERGRVYNVVLDSADSTLGCLLFLYPFVSISFAFIFLGVVFLSCVHILINLILFALNLREQPL